MVNRKIIIFTGMYANKYGALEKYFVHLADTLQQNGIQLYLVYNRTPTSDKYREDLRRFNVELIILRIDKLFKKVNNLIKKTQPDIVHTHFDTRVRIVALLASKFNSVKFKFTTLHSILPITLRQKLLWKLIYSLSDKLFAVSEASKKNLVCLGLKKEKIYVEKLGVFIEKIPYSKLEIRNKYQLPIDKLLLCNISLHIILKRIDLLIKALAIIIKKHPNVHLCQIGYADTDYSKYIHKLGDELGVSQNISWMGIQNNIPELLRAMDIYCHPARSEALGLCLVEAAVAELPLVGTNKGIPETINHNVNGFLFENGNLEQLVEQLLKLIENKDLRNKMGLESYKFVLENNDVKKQSKRMVEKYYNSL